MIYARLAADADQFLTMAKFRAMRHVVGAGRSRPAALRQSPLFVAADTAWRMLTQRDAYVNMLRATMATFSAGLGGADSIDVLPQTLALGLPDGFARRAARNTQLVLLAELNLAKVSYLAAWLRRHRNPDATALRGGVAALTFQEIEKAGGVRASPRLNKA